MEQSDWENIEHQFTKDPVELLRRRAHVPEYVRDFIDIVVRWIPAESKLQLIAVPLCTTESGAVNGAALVFTMNGQTPIEGKPALMVREDGALMLISTKDLTFNGKVI